MIELDAMGVQELATQIYSRGRDAVNRIADHWMTNGLHVYADLVSTTRFEEKLDQSKVSSRFRVVCEDKKRRTGWPTVCDYGLSSSDSRMSPNRPVDCS